MNQAWIIVVDHNEMRCRYFAEAAKRFKYCCLAATSKTEESIELIRSHTPSLIVMNRGMPDTEMTGILEAIRGIPDYTPLVYPFDSTQLKKVINLLSAVEPDSLSFTEALAPV